MPSAGIMFLPCLSRCLSVPLSVPCQHWLTCKASRAGRRPAYCLCGRVNSYAHMYSPTGMSITQMLLWGIRWLRVIFRCLVEFCVNSQIGVCWWRVSCVQCVVICCTLCVKLSVLALSKRPVQTLQKIAAQRNKNQERNFLLSYETD